MKNKQLGKREEKKRSHDLSNCFSFLLRICEIKKKNYICEKLLGRWMHDLIYLMKIKGGLGLTGGGKIFYTCQHTHLNVCVCVYFHLFLVVQLMTVFSNQ